MYYNEEDIVMHVVRDSNQQSGHSSESVHGNDMLYMMTRPDKHAVIAVLRRSLTGVNPRTNTLSASQ